MKAETRSLHPRERELVPTVQKAEWTSELVWTGEENLALNWGSIPDRPACSTSRHRLRFLGRGVRTQIS